MKYDKVRIVAKAVGLTVVLALGLWGCQPQESAKQLAPAKSPKVASKAPQTGQTPKAPKPRRTAPAEAVKKPAPVPVRTERHLPLPVEANIILVQVSCLRADSLGCYGYERNTSPNIDQLASEGIAFDRCYANTTATRASVASMMSSRYPGLLGIDGPQDSIPSDTILLPVLLRLHNYVNFGAVSDVAVAPQWGFRKGFSDFIRVWLDKPEGQESGAVPDEASFSAERMNQVLFRLLENNKDQKFFIYAFFSDLQIPYSPKQEYLARFGELQAGKFDGSREGMQQLAEALKNGPEQYVQDIAYLKALYDAEIAYFDDQFGQLMDKVKQLGIYDKTLVVLTSDHGESFFEHRKLGHGTSVYQEEAHVPLIIKGPAIPKGARIPGLVGLVDLMPSLLDYSGAKIPRSRCVGTSFWDLVRRRKDSLTDSIFIDLKHSEKKIRKRALVTSNFKMIENLDSGKKELFNLREDPGEQENLYRPKSKIAQQLVEAIAERNTCSYQDQPAEQ